MKRKLLYLGAFLLGINSLAVAQAANYQDGFFIQNEGWFGHDNGSINWFGNDGSAVYTVEQKENAGDKELLGATSQFGTIYGGKYYALSKMNNQIVVFDAVTMKKEDVVSGISGNVNCIAFASDEKAYISTTNGLFALNLTNNTMADDDLSKTGAAVGLIQRVGNYIFAASESGVILVIDPTDDSIVTKVSTPGNNGFVVSKDGNVWANCGSSLTRINPVTFETKQFNVSNQLPVVWNPWKPDLLVASQKENALFYGYGGDWSQNKVGKFVIDAEGELKEDPSFSFVMPAGVTESNTQEIYGQIGFEPHSGQLLVLTVQSGWGDNYTHNWIHKVNAATGAIEESVKVASESGKGYYWFAAMPVFTDTQDPELNFGAELVVSKEEPLSISKADFLIDADNMPALASLSVSVADNTLAEATTDGMAVKVSPLKNGITSLVVTANSNGKEVTKEVPLRITAFGGVEDNLASEFNAYVLGSQIVVSGVADGSAEIYNLSGALVGKFAVDGETVYGTENLASGVYVVKVSDNFHSKLYKVVIK